MQAMACLAGSLLTAECGLSTARVWPLRGLISNLWNRDSATSEALSLWRWFHL